MADQNIQNPRGPRTEMRSDTKVTLKKEAGPDEPALKRARSNSHRSDGSGTGSNKRVGTQGTLTMPFYCCTVFIGDTMD